MRDRGKLGRRLLLLALLALIPIATHASVDSGVIRLRPQEDAEPVPEESADVANPDAFAGPRRGFDYESFEARLESLWFQRKTFLANGREADAADQSQLIRSFCEEEGIRRLDRLAGALVAESRRYLEDGRYDQALASLNLAESFDPGRPQTRYARSVVYWKSGRGKLAAAGELVAAARNSVVRSFQDLSLFNQAALVLVVALVGCVILFSVLMLIRYNVPFRHEIEERVVQMADDRLARAAGWAVLFLPMLLWIGTGWVALYWIVITFRFMRRAERLTAAALVLATLISVPAYRISVAVYGLTADPVVRTTLASSGGEYDPNRILKLRELVQAYPDDPVYRFLLAGLYKNGRYFEEAFAEYKQALELDASMEEAHINIGNIFHTTGQHPEALASYRRALEVKPNSLLAYFNLHLTQSEAFRFKEAEESLNRARAIDSKRLAELLTAAGSKGERPAVIDATLQMASVWEAALGGGQPQQMLEGAAGRNRFTWLWQQFINPVSLVALISLGACGIALLTTRKESPARRCIRCGRPFCHYCKSSREGHEYCSQCLHLYVLGDGLAPETKTRKIYEVERYERASRRGKKLASLLLPGTAQLLRGRAGLGAVMLLAWLAALVAWQPVLLRPLEHATGLDLHFDLLGPDNVPAAFTLNPVGILGLVAVLVIWTVGNAWRWSRREA